MYIVILLVTVVFSLVAVGGTIPKADPYPVEKPVEVKVASAVQKADSQNAMQLYTFTGEPILPTPACPVAGNIEVMFVIDYSGSTRGEKLAKEKSAAGVFIDTLARNPQNRVGFVVFNSETRLVSELSGDFSLVKQKIRSLPDGSGFTCIKCGIELANSHLASNARQGLPRIMVLLTDGYANRPEPKETALSLTRAAVSQGYQQYKIKSYPIGFSGDPPRKGWGGGDQGVNEPLMRELASLGGGRYYYAPTTSDLGNVLRDLGISLLCQSHQDASGAQPPPQITQPVATPVPTL